MTIRLTPVSESTIASVLPVTARMNARGRCHTSPRFASSKLKNGSDPYRLYQTLTHGYGLMVAQRWMVPQQKYAVIHYLREEYFREDNPQLFTKVDDAYLESLPKGDTLGPEPVEYEPWATMDYGPVMHQTFENPGESWGSGGARLRPRAARARSVGQSRSVFPTRGSAQLCLQRSCHSARSGTRGRVAGEALDGLRSRHHESACRLER